MARRWWILAVLCLTALLEVLDVMIVNVALPTISSDLHASTSQLQWVMDAYTLAFSGPLLLAGNLGDRLGRRLFLQAGLVIFIGSSAAAALSHTTAELITARAAMGFGAALSYPATLAILNNVFTAARDRAIAMGTWSAASGLGVAVGPVSGGALLRHYSWPSIFWVGAAVAVISLAAGAWLLPESRDRNAGRFDLLGALLSIAGITLLTWAIIEAPSFGWRSDTVMGAFAEAAAILAAFIWWQIRKPDPMLDVRLFRNARFSAASAAISLAFFGLYGFVFVMTQYFQTVRGYDTLGAGLATVPFAVIAAVTAPIAMHGARAGGNRFAVAAGTALIGAGLILISAVLEPATPYWGMVIVIMALMAIGYAFSTGPATDAIMSALPPARAGAGAAVNDATRILGGTLGIAVIGSVLATAYTPRAVSGMLQAGAPMATARAGSQSVMAGMAVAARFPASARPGAVHAVSTAFMAGMHRGSLVAGIALAAAAVVVLAFMPSRTANVTGNAPRHDAPEVPVTSPRLPAQPRDRQRTRESARSANPRTSRVSAAGQPCRFPACMASSAPMTCGDAGEELCVPISLLEQHR
jgi:EmrB/QacA subfamily drug resistance transporter